MTTRFRMYCRLLLPAFLLAAGAAHGQVPMSPGPLSSDPGRAAFIPKTNPAALQRTAPLALPFFDDFTSPLEGRPRESHWEARGGAYVSNRLAVAPPTRGAATLDGLKANGQSYSGGTTVSYGTIDSLKSQPIDLSSLSANSGVYLSFAWQAGVVDLAPARNGSATPVHLDLFLKTASNSWVRAWSYNSQNVRTGFRQQLIAINQAQYLHGTFQFMFVATGSTSENRDAWSIDYVLLDRGRTGNLQVDTTFVDVAAGAGLVGGNPSGGLRSPLRRFTSMPVWQFNAATTQSDELNPQLGVNFTNLENNLPRPIDVRGTVTDLSTNAPLGTWLQVQTPIDFYTRQFPVAQPAGNVTIPTSTTTPKRLRYTLALLNGPNPRDIPRALPNDTISRDLELSNYYAYDDGTAERYYGIPSFPSGQQGAYAYRIDLNQPDHVGGLRLFPVYTPGDINPRPVTISVWPNDNGKPAATPLAAKSVTLPGVGPGAGGAFVDILFDQPVPVSGVFFVGFSQPSNNRDLKYGFDINSSIPAGHYWYRSNVGVWDSVQLYQRRGAFMMRPVMTNNVTTASASARETAAYSLYPNPARGTVRIDGPGFARAAVLDALGRTVWEQPAAQAGQPTLPLPTLPPGVYTVRLTLADGRTVGRRLLLE
ncbi:T9SS type A sorting domain-containing protein [Hymenobacter ruricola]|uniref:T9SS type A sorting domain-containing protein n=1 Tax=Hymenobacter ruricola TaxID=2791023 RepID=A0ABS0I7S4_9BACT|nr:T9SS type A sorting domain-containing protein [Hymenobacter ruricola]MBF9222980.1 T9SS type A sorting domain-containing protein [Hymenobacter ruricola]